MNAHRAIVPALVGFVWLTVGSLQAQSAPPAQTGAASVTPDTSASTSAPAPGAAAAPQTAAVPAAAEAVATPAVTAPAPVAPAAPSPAQPAPATTTIPAHDFAAAMAQAPLDSERPPTMADPDERKVGNPKFGKPSDHDDVVGRWAIAYFGVRSIPVADSVDSDESVPTPVLGARHWFTDTLGLDVGLGFGYAITGGNSYVDGGDEVNSPQTGVFAFNLYTGLPLSIYDAGHFNALIIPELNLGFANGLEEAGTSATGLDEFPRGLMFGVGARAGAEIHLDFIDVPQVVLQFTVGFSLQYTTRTLETETTAGEVSGRTAGKVAISSDATSPTDWLAAGLQVLWYL